MSDVEVMRLSRQVNEMQQQKTERISRFRQEAATDLVRVQSDLAQLDEQQIVRQDALSAPRSKSRARRRQVHRGRHRRRRRRQRRAHPRNRPLGPCVLVEAASAPRTSVCPRRPNGRGQAHRLRLQRLWRPRRQGHLPQPRRHQRRRQSPDGGYYRAIVTAERNNLKYMGEAPPVIPSA